MTVTGEHDRLPEPCGCAAWLPAGDLGDPWAQANDVVLVCSPGCPVSPGEADWRRVRRAEGTA